MVTLKNLFIALAVALVGAGSIYIARMRNNNPVEQAAEEIITNQIGINIDLSSLDTILTARK